MSVRETDGSSALLGDRAVEHKSAQFSGSRPRLQVESTSEMWLFCRLSSVLWVLLCGDNTELEAQSNLVTCLAPKEHQFETLSFKGTLFQR